MTNREAVENNFVLLFEADEIEVARWYKESAYEGYYPADDFKTVWER